MKENKKDTYDDLLTSSNKSLYEQSSKVSTISRGMVYAIIATIWAISYKEGAFSIPRGWLLVTICLCGAFILLDLIHYYIDTRFHYNQTQTIFWHKNLTKESNRDDVIKYAKNARLSFGFLRAKFYLAISVMICFIIGIVYAS